MHFILDFVIWESLPAIKPYLGLQWFYDYGPPGLHLGGNNIKADIDGSIMIDLLEAFGDPRHLQLSWWRCECDEDESSVVAPHAATTALVSAAHRAWHQA